MTNLEDSNTKSYINNWWKIIDQPIIISISILMLFGMILVTTGSYAVANRIGVVENYFSLRQSIYLGISIILIITLSFANKKFIVRGAVLGFLVTLFFLILLPYYGYEIKGARRWINIYHISLQPSEFIKPFFFVIIGWILSLGHKNNFPSVRLSFIIYALIAICLILQPDFGMLIMFSVTFVTQLFVAGIPIIWLFFLFGIGLFGVLNAYLFFPHVAIRINNYLNAKIALHSQTNKSLLAFQNGGLYGQGPGEGVIKQHLADSHTDFIFAVAGEELGSILCAIIIITFAFIVIHTLWNLYQEDDKFTQITITGIITQFGLQSAINIGVSLNLLPTKGMTLPFISYGGSSTIATAIAFGIILALTKRNLSLIKYKNREVII